MSSETYATSDRRTEARDSREQAVTRLLTAVHDVAERYGGTAHDPGPRTGRLGDDAHLVTAEIARELDIARQRLRAAPVPG